MKFKLEINMDNAIFDNIPGIVLADMLEKVALRVSLAIDKEEIWGIVYDINGNKVGTFEIDTK